MKTQITIGSIFAGLLVLSGCANPAAVVQEEAVEFKEKYPQQVVSVESEGRQLQFAWSGDPNRRALIFVHGSPGSWDVWAHFLNDSQLRERFQIIAVDRPGYGGSNPGETERSLQKQAALVMEALKINKSGLPAILIGHSYGGPVVAQIAMSYPERVGGVVFVASSVDPDLEKTKWYQYPADWWVFRSLLPSPLKVCNQEIFALKDELTRMSDRWRSFSPKVITIQGQDDDLVPAANQDFLLRVLEPKLILSVVRVPGLNHFVPWKRPDLILSAISRMSEALDGY